MDRFLGMIPIEAEPALESFLRALPEGTLHKEWMWAFHGGKTSAYETPYGSTVYLSHATSFGHLVVAVVNDKGGIVERLRAQVALVDLPALARRAEGAATDAAKIDALCALASAQSMAGSEALPEFLAAERRALADPNRGVRLAAIRASAILPLKEALALLDGREDPENPDLAGWRDHYREQLAEG